MSESKIVTKGHEALNTICSDIPHGSDVKEITSDMQNILSNTSGVGLAANQIGITKRLILINAARYGFSGFMINPVITRGSKKLIEFEEQCLSVPDYTGKTIRHKKVTVEYYDENWVKQKKTCLGILSIIVQHEIDHLNGITIGDDV